MLADGLLPGIITQTDRACYYALDSWILWHLDRENEAASWDAFVSGFQKGYDKEGLPQFDRIPSPKLHVMPLNVKFGLAGRSLAVFTESLGASVITVT